MHFFSILSSDLELILNFAFLDTHIDLFEEKSLQLYLKKSYAVYTPLLHGFVSVGETQYIHA